MWVEDNRKIVNARKVAAEQNRLQREAAKARQGRDSGFHHNARGLNASAQVRS